MKYVIVIDGQYWQVLEDGTLKAISQEQYQALSSNNEVTLIQSSQRGDNVSLSNSGGGNSDISSQDPTINLATFFANVNRSGYEQLPESGFLSRSPSDELTDVDDGFTEQDVTPPPLAEDAQIFVDILEGDDEYLNSSEVPVADIVGQTAELFDGQSIEVTVTDSEGRSIIFETTVDNNQYTISGRDLTSLAQGPATVEAIARDFYGNIISATDETIIDTLATIDNQQWPDDPDRDIDPSVPDIIWTSQDEAAATNDALLNPDQLSALVISGQAQFIEPGQTIALSISDQAGNTVESSTVLDSEGQFSFAPQNLAGFVDGDISITTRSQDLAGNLAEKTDVFVKDSQAASTIVFDGVPPFGADELTGVSVSGLVTGIEPGQKVSVVVVDSNGATLDYGVVNVKADGSWQTAQQDWSGLAEGEVTASIETIDRAGNFYSADQSTFIDLNVQIDIDSDPINIDDIRAGNLISITGSTDAEVGQSVTVTFANILGQSQSFSGLVTNAPGQTYDNAFSVDVEVTDLASFSEWTLVASVLDQAGNSAADSTPTIISPTSVVLSQGALVDFPSGYSVPSFIRVSDYDTIGFSLDQSSLESVTVGGVGLTVTGQGTDALTASASGVEVLTAVIDPALNTVLLTLKSTVDQGGIFGPNGVAFNLNLDATQTDVNDSTEETVAASLPVLIRDSGPFTVDDEFEAIEAEPFTANVFDNDNLLEGPLTLITAEYAGTTQIVTALAPASFTTDEGELKVFSDGRVEFLSNRNLDNRVLQQIDFNYGALDNDEDYSSSGVSIIIKDGKGGFFPSEEGDVTEPKYANIDIKQLTFEISAGSDDLDPTSIRFAATQESLLNVLGYQSSGQDIDYALINGSQTIQATIRGQADVVFELSLTAVAKGDGSGDLVSTASFDQRLPLDHVEDITSAFSGLPFDVKSFPLVASAEDLDGTVSSTSATLLINDGDDIAISATDTQVSEDDIISNLSSITPATDTGAVNLTIGSDSLADIGFVAGKQPAVTAGGASNQLQYEIQNDGLTLVAYLTDVADPHFTIQLDDIVDPTADNALSYTFELFKAIDQLDVNGVGVASIELDFVFQSTDFDGDVTESSLNVTINDSGPGTIGNVTATITETPKDPLNLTVPKQASLNFNVSAGKDAITMVEFDLVDGSAVLDSLGNSVTQNGQALLWSQQSTSLWTAQNDKGQDVFRAQLPNAIDIQPGDSDVIQLDVKTLQAIDQDSGNELVLDVPIVVLDSDFSALEGKAAITILDGRDPAIGEASNLVVDERGTLDKPAASFINSNKDSGSVNLIKGSDRIAEVILTLETEVFTANGDEVSLSSVPDSSGWFLATAGGDDVFRVRVSRTGDAEFELFQAIMHPEPTGTDASDANTKELQFNLLARDVDGDESDASLGLTVVVVDDVPNPTDRVVQVTEGSVRKFNLLNDEVKEGADTAIIQTIIYDPDGDGTQRFDVTEGSFIEVELKARAGSTGKYGTLTVFSDGRVITRINESNDSNFEDKFSYEVIDKDGDLKTSQVTLNVQDEGGNITIEPLNTVEDENLTLILRADPGDIDINEAVQFIVFDNSLLEGSQLFLKNGMVMTELAKDIDGNYLLSSRDGTLIDAGSSTDGEVKPNGDLIFSPALNISDPTATVVLKTTVKINEPGSNTLIGTVVEFDVSIAPVVDDPIFDSNTLNYTQDEDADPVALSISASLFDVDGSESLSYRIENIDTDLTLFLGSNQVVNGQSLSESQLAQLSYSVVKDFSGQLSFDTFAIAEETSTGDTAEVKETITINVAGVADKPILESTNLLSDEDVLIKLSDIIDAQLSDIDGSEELFFELTLPGDGWSVVDSAKVALATPAPGSNVVRVSFADVANDVAFLKPKEDISSVSPGGSVFEIPVRAVAVESIQDGVAPSVPEAFSGERTVKLTIAGVNDLPDFDAGDQGLWTYTPSGSGTGTLSAQADEDALIALNFGTGTQDDDGSEIFDFVIKNVPDGVDLVDQDGNFALLKVLGEESGKPVYSLSAAELNQLFVRAAPDFSGEVQFDLVQTNTEPDGASSSFAQTVLIEFLPVVESDISLYDIIRGGEDQQTPFIIKPVYNDPDDPDIQYDDLGDLDESEAMTNIIVESIPDGAVFLVDGIEIAAVPNLNLAQVAANNGYTFDELINDGRLTIRPPEDSGRNFQIPVQLEITDTSPTGASDVRFSSATIFADIWAIVDDNAEDGITRIESPNTPLISSDGSAIDLTGMATFIEEDIDGSERIDYISLSLPVGEEHGWYISGAINDGQGNWLIKNNGLTSDSVVDVVDILQGVTIVSDHVVSPAIDIEVKVRVLDQRNSGADRDFDSDMLFSSISVEFLQPGSMGSVEDVSILEREFPIDGQEHNDDDREFGNAIPPVDISQHINQDASGDANDVVSFRIDASDRPQGGWFRGSGLVEEYQDDGSTVKAWVFPQSALADLRLVGQDEDFSGDMTIPVYKIATDPLGKTSVTTEDLIFDIIPEVDEIDEDAATIEMIEDIPARIAIDLESLLNDRSVSPAQDNEGIETILSVTFSNLPSGASFDYTGNAPGVFVDNGDGSFTLSDPSEIENVRFVPPKHKHGEMFADMSLEIKDETQGSTAYSNVDVATKTTQLSFIVIADTDPAPIFTATQEGDEDTLIEFSNVFALDIDSDGSETLSLQYRGVPDGATLFYNNGSDLVPLVNDGPDGSGGFAWSFTLDQANDIVFKPPRDFSGDITLTLRSTSMELSTQEIVTVDDQFLVKVNPIADGADFNVDLQDLQLLEGDSIDIVLDAKQQEQVNPNETLGLVVQIDTTASDPSAYNNILGIRLADGSQAFFASLGTNLTAALNVTSDRLDGFELVLADDAFGHLEVAVGVGSRDEAIVGGSLVVDESTGLALQSFSIDLTPLPDAPILELTAFNIEAGVDDVPLGLSLSLVQPQASPDEVNELYIEGLPAGVTVSGASYDAGLDVWVAQANAVPDLSLTGVVPSATYNLTLQPRATLNGEIDNGPRQTLTVNMADDLSGPNTITAVSSVSNLIIGGDGDDSITLAASIEDTVYYRDDDLGPTLNIPEDTLINFDLNQDRIDISSITSLNTAADLDGIIDITENVDGDAVIEIDLGSGGVLDFQRQNIVLDGISRTALNGGSAPANDTELLQTLLDQQTLITG